MKTIKFNYKPLASDPQVISKTEKITEERLQELKETGRVKNGGVFGIVILLKDVIEITD
jgi:hypothetical protein